MLTDHFQGPQLGAAWIFLGLGWILSPNKSIGNKWVFSSLLVLIGSAYFSVLGSIWWGFGNWDQTLSLAIWITPMIIFYLIDIDRSLLKWWIPWLGLHAVLILVKGLGFNVIQAPGLASHPGIASSMLLIGLLVLSFNSSRRWKLLGPLFLAGMIVSGARLPLLALGLAGLGSLGPLSGIQEFLRNNKVLVVLSLVPLLLLLLNVNIIPTGLRLDRNQFQDVQNRTEITNPISITPLGYYHSDGLHSVVTKVGSQMGLHAAIILTVLTLWSLTRRPLFTVDWWILMSLVLMSILELYPWLGPLSVVWWLAIGWRTKHGDPEDSRVFREPDDSLEETISSETIT